VIPSAASTEELKFTNHSFSRIYCHSSLYNTANSNDPHKSGKQDRTARNPPRKGREKLPFPCSLKSYPAVLADVSTSNFLTLHPQFTCLCPGRKGVHNIC